MAEPDSKSSVWRRVHATAMGLVLAAFPFGIRGLLDPFVCDV